MTKDGAQEGDDPAEPVHGAPISVPGVPIFATLVRFHRSAKHHCPRPRVRLRCRSGRTGGDRRTDSRTKNKAYAKTRSAGGWVWRRPRPSRVGSRPAGPIRTGTRPRSIRRQTTASPTSSVASSARAALRRSRRPTPSPPRRARRRSHSTSTRSTVGTRATSASTINSRSSSTDKRR